MKQKIMFFFFLNLLSSGTFSQNGMTIPDFDKSVVIPSNLIEIFCDSTNSLVIDQLRSGIINHRFIPVSSYKNELSNNFTYWIRFSILDYNIAESNTGVYIPLEDHIADVYTISDSILKTQRTGFFVNSQVNDEIIPLSNILRIEGNGKLDFFIRIRNINDELPEFGISLVSIEKAIQKNRKKVTIDAIVQGMIWLMIMYGLFLFIIHREKLYLFYTLYALFLSFWLMGTWGFYYQFIYRLPREVYAYQGIPGFLAMIFYVQFIRSFFNTPVIFPGWDKTLRLTLLIIVIEIVWISVFLPLSNLLMTNYYIQATLSMIIELLFLVFIIKVLMTRIQFKYIIGIGSIILIVSNFAGALLWVIQNDNSWFILQKTGVVLELMIFSFGLSYRYWIIEQKEHKLKEKLIIQLNKNAELKDKVTRELEEKVQERTVELKEKNEVLEYQKNEIEYHSNNLTISINYAQKIQSAVFPSDDILSSNFPEHFILFRPLDIVSGDFYWFRETDNYIFVAAADCTGHGVPGAFMSILGITFLNEIVKSNIRISSGELLDRLRAHVIKTLRQSHDNTGTRVGIDMALCIFDRQKHILHFSGAFRPLYLIRENQLLEFKGDHTTVGIYDDVVNAFSSKEIALKDNDTIYLFTDGYVDQTGGTQRKTFKTIRLKELLVKITNQPMNVQKEILEKRIDEWRGSLGQVDDMLVIGIRYRNR